MTCASSAGSGSSLIPGVALLPTLVSHKGPSRVRVIDQREEAGSSPLFLPWPLDMGTSGQREEPVAVPIVPLL